MNRIRHWLRGNAYHSVVRLVVTHWILGALLGVACAALVLWLDIAGLRGLMFRESSTMTAGLILLFAGFAITFGGVVSASAVMTVPVDADGPTTGLRPAPGRGAAAGRSVALAPLRGRQSLG